MSRCLRMCILLATVCLLFTATTFATESSPPWRSVLYPENWTPGFTDSQGRFLHDFSYAGYHAGEKPLPVTVSGPRVDVTQPPYNADNSGKESASKAIQAAINDVGKVGGGTVYLPAGTYRITFEMAGMNTALFVAYSNVVIQGDGTGKTFLFLDETVTRGKSMISIEPILTGMSWTAPKDGVVQNLRTDVEARQTVIPLDGAPRFAVGEWVVVQYNLTKEWITEHNMSDGWDSSISGPAFYRQVVATDTVNNTITLDAPIRYAVKVRDNGRVYRVSTPLTEVGLADFSFGMRENPATKGWGDADHGTPGTGAYDVHTGRAVSFRGVVNSWVRDVATYKPAGNKYAHIQSIGFSFSQSRYVTLQRVSVENPQYRGGGGNGYPFVVGGQDSLFDNCRAINGRHNFTISGMQASGNVIYRGYISNPTEGLAADFHSYLSMANLIDNLTIDHDRFEAADRSSAAGVSGFPKHGVSTTASVFWNNEGLSYRRDLPVMIRSDQFGVGYVIGTRGPAAKVALGGSGRTNPVDFLEGEGQGASLQPQSLYVDQLQRRLLQEGKATQWEALHNSLTPPPIKQYEQVAPQKAPQLSSVELPLIHKSDFESTTVGEIPEGWSWLEVPNSPSKPSVVQAPAQLGVAGGTKVLALTRTASTNNATWHAVYDFAPVYEQLRVSFKLFATTERRSLRITMGGSSRTSNEVHSTTANAGIYIAMNGGSIQSLLDAAANKWIIGGTYAPGRWYKVTLDINVAAQTFNVYLDDDKTPSNTEPIPFFSKYLDLNTIAFGYQSVSSHNNTAPVYVDAVVISGK